ncbi:MAG: DUF2135 domain-containing protein [Myxococcota bacterium]
MRVLLFASLVAALPTAAMATPTVTIQAPAAGWTTERIVTVTGQANGAAALGILSVNGVERPLTFTGGSFSATFALARGQNAIEVIAPPADGKGASARARLNLFAQIPRVDLQVLLFWDTDKTDVDLHVKEPSGEVVNFTHTVSEKTGGRLDRDDTDGYGPEIYSLGSAPAGLYEISAHYFGDRGTGQTTATVIVVAREGTDEEMRWRFEVPLTREGELAKLADIDLPPPGVGLDKNPKLSEKVETKKDAPLPNAHGH